MVVLSQRLHAVNLIVHSVLLIGNCLQSGLVEHDEKGCEKEKAAALDEAATDDDDDNERACKIR